MVYFKHFLYPISVSLFVNLFKLSLLIFLISFSTIYLNKIGTQWKPVPTINDGKITMIKQDLKKLGLENEKNIDVFSKSIKVASEVTNIDDRIITTVILIESNFKVKAVSPKGYKGLMQTRVASMEHPEVDIMMGAKELQKWINYRKGDLKFALASYNGGEKPPKVSWDYAEDAIRIIRSL